MIKPPLTAPLHLRNDIKSVCPFVIGCYTRLVCIGSFWMRMTTFSALSVLLDWSSQVSSLALLFASIVLLNLVWILLYIVFCENIKLKTRFWPLLPPFTCIGQLKCDGTRAETIFRLSAKRTSPFKSAGASVQSTTGSRGVRISGSNDGYTMIRGSVKGTGYPLQSPVSLSLPIPCVTVCHHISTGVYCYLSRFVITSDFEVVSYQLAPSLHPSVSQVEIWRKFHTVSTHERVGCLNAQ